MLYRARKASAFAIALAVSVLLAVSHHAEAARACATPPVAVTSLKLARYYSDAAGTRIDRNLKKMHRAQVKPLATFLRHVVKDADKSIQSRNPARAAAAGQCALTWLDAWAKGGALLGPMSSKQAQYERKWTMTGIALGYLKVGRFATTKQRQTIDPWLIHLADRSRAFFDDRGRRRNNHWYWLGLGLGATAIATGSQRHWTMARGIMRDAANDIAANGTVAFEMARKGRALKYHAFAAMPLVTLAELAHSRGENWYGFGGGALHRLVAVTWRGLQHHELFQQLNGFAQKQPVQPGAGWLQIYRARFPARMARMTQNPLPPMKSGHRWLGGNVFALQRVLQAHPAPSPSR